MFQVPQHYRLGDFYYPVNTNMNSKEVDNGQYINERVLINRDFSVGGGIEPNSGYLTTKNTNESFHFLCHNLNSCPSYCT